MYDSTSMSASGIQAFLNAEQPTCASGATCLKSVTMDVQAMPANPMCSALAAAKSQTAAQVIAKVASVCHLNPQVILVMLQKEQTLVTGRRPYSGESVSLIYRKATGLGCPDTAPCDPAKYGLFNQLYGVAYWLLRYTTPAGTSGPGWTSYSWFPVGRPTTVLYNPSGACGGKAITIANKATASLYYYTPYQPNAAALAAGWGSGNSCSAYGNRNFFLYFTTWFGSTHQEVPAYPVTGAIATAWKAAGGATGPLGLPEAKAKAITSAGGGTSQAFAHGTVYSSSTAGVGAWAVSGALLTQYLAQDGPAGPLGWPRMASATRTANGGGTVQGFQHGTLYSSKSGVRAVPGAIYTRYGKAGYEAGALGWPSGARASSTLNGGGAAQAFTGGRISTSKAGTFAVLGAVSTRYRASGYSGGTLGWPTADAVVTTGAHGGTVQTFTGGAIASATGAAPRAVVGAAWTAWKAHALGAGPMGWPVAEAAAVTAHGQTWTVQAFQNTSAYVHGSTTWLVTGALLQDYAFHGGPAGRLGWPAAAGRTSTVKGGGRSQAFAGGSVFWSPSLGVHWMLPPETTLYAKLGGAAGVLGWPGLQRADAHGTGGAARDYTGGRVYVSKAGTVSVRGHVLAAYLAKGGTASSLGWPVAEATVKSGKAVQRFEHGTLTAAAG